MDDKLKSADEDGSALPLGSDELAQDDHLPASEADAAKAASSGDRGTHLPASESGSDLGDKPDGEAIVERGLTNLPPG